MVQTEVTDMSDKYFFLLELCVQMNRIKLLQRNNIKYKGEVQKLLSRQSWRQRGDTETIFVNVSFILQHIKNNKGGFNQLQRKARQWPNIIQI